MLVKLNQSYENTCFVFDHRAGDRRAFQLLSVTEERGDCGNDHDQHSRHGQEDDSEDDCEEDFDVGFDRSVAISIAEEDCEEKACG